MEGEENLMESIHELMLAKRGNKLYQCFDEETIVITRL